MTKAELQILIQSWENLALLMQHLCEHPEHIDALMNLAFDDTDNRNWRAAWMIDKIHEKHPEMILPYLPVMTDFVMQTQNGGKKRHLLKLISLHEIQEEKMGELLNFCIEVFANSNEAIAIRVHAMQVLFVIAQKEPDFAGELIELILHEIEYRGSAGIASRGKKLLKKLYQINQNPKTRSVC